MLSIDWRPHTQAAVVMAQVADLDDPFIKWPDFKLEYEEVTDDEASGGEEED